MGVLCKNHTSRHFLVPMWQRLMGSNDQLINTSTRQTNLSGSNSSGAELNKQDTMSSNDPTESTFRAPKKKFIQLVGQEGGGRGVVTVWRTQDVGRHH